jgi:ATP-dependent DNA helicase PIF1
MIPTDMPFEFKRIQFPICRAFAMTINKSQGQSLSVCGLNLENKCFSHGQLYYAGQKILAVIVCQFKKKKKYRMCRKDAR